MFEKSKTLVGSRIERLTAVLKEAGRDIDELTNQLQEATEAREKLSFELDALQAELAAMEGSPDA